MLSKPKNYYKSPWKDLWDNEKLENFIKDNNVTCVLNDNTINYLAPAANAGVTYDGFITGEDETVIENKDGVIKMLSK